MTLLVSPSTHTESKLTGSPLSSMIQKAVELNRTHFSYTDLGHLSSFLKAYGQAKAANLKFAGGIEFFFKDSSCPIVVGSRADRCKYFNASIFAKTQDAYQEIVRVVSSNDMPKIKIRDELESLWSWKDLERLSKADTLLVLGGPHCAVGKVLLADSPELAEKILLKLHSFFGDRLSMSLTCEPWDKKFATVIKIQYKNGTSDSLLSTDLVTTNKARKIKASDLVNRSGHFLVKSKVVGSTFYEVEKGIAEATEHKGFLPLPVDVTLTINQFFIEMNKKHRINLLVSDYAFYADREDHAVQTMILGGENKLKANLHMKSEGEFRDYLTKKLSLTEEECGQIIGNNNEWAKNFDNFELTYKWRLADGGENPLQKCIEIIKQKGLMRWKDPTWVSRLKEEIEVIAKNGIFDLSPYFLPIHDVINHYEDNGKLTGPGRGSAAGSLLAYLMGITKVNPFEYDLSFNRFYSMDRIKALKLSDIDQDLESRDLLVGKDGESGYLYSRWGNKAAQISTRGKTRLKSAIKDTNRYFNGSVEKSIELLTKSLPDAGQGITDEQFLFGMEDDDGNHIDGLIETSEPLQKYSTDRPKEWAIVRNSLGITRSFSRHACGFIISDKPISEIAPIKDGNVIQYEAAEAEKAGLIKYDFLIISQLKDIRICIDLINKKNKEKHKTGHFTHNGKLTYIWDLPTDPASYESVWGGNTESCFQINTASMIPFVKGIKPKNIEDLAIILSLVRPGPLDYIDEETGRSMAEEYVHRRDGGEYKDVEILKELIPETHSVLCVKKGSFIKTEIGPLEIEKVLIGQKVQTEDGTFQTVLGNHYKGRKKVLKIRMDNSEELEVTPEHKVLTSDGWKEAGSLTDRDLVKHFWASDDLIEEGDLKDWIVGLVLADGNLCGTTIDICAGDKIENATRIKLIVDSEFGINSSIYFNTRSYYVLLSNKGDRFTCKNSNKITNLFKDLGVYGKDSFNKEFPKRVTKKMIEGFIEGDGCVANGRIRIKNEKMARSLFNGLQSLRVKSSFFLDTTDPSNHVNTVSFDSSKLEFQLKKEIYGSKKGRFFPKNIIDKREILEENDKQYFYAAKMQKTPFMSEYLLDKMTGKYGLTVKKDSWSKVVSIREGLEEEVYDLSIETNHSFLVGGNVVHNCYQEQVTKVAKQLAGFSGSAAENLREAIGKKKRSTILKIKPDFIDGCLKSNKITEEEAQILWDRIVTFGRYAFNKSHAVSYAFITYACVFLKHNYPLEFWSGVLTNAKEKEISGKLWQHVKGYLAPPDINLSTDEMEIDYANGKIRAKLGVIKGMAAATIDPIVAGRPYKDIEEFVNKEVAGDSTTRKLIHVGVLDSLFPPKLELLQKMQMFEDLLELNKFNKKMAKAEKEGKKVRIEEPHKGVIKEEYLEIEKYPLKNAAVQKSILPSLLVGLKNLGSNHSGLIDRNSAFKQAVMTKKARKKRQENPNARLYREDGDYLPLLDAEEFEFVDQKTSEMSVKDIEFAVFGYVVGTSIFDYSQNTKQALKVTIDLDGYVKEHVMWPNYYSKKLEYPNELKKGNICMFLMKKRQGSGDPAVIEEIIIEA